MFESPAFSRRRTVSRAVSWMVSVAVHLTLLLLLLAISVPEARREVQRRWTPLAAPRLSPRIARRLIRPLRWMAATSVPGHPIVAPAVPEPPVITASIPETTRNIVPLELEQRRPTPPPSPEIAPKPQRTVTVGTFGEVAHAAVNDTAPSPLQVGVFEGRRAGTLMSSTTRQAVGVSGFGDTAVAERSATPSMIARGGSGFSDMRAASPQPLVRAQVSGTQFDSVETQPSAGLPVRPAPKGPSMGVEILEKPRPEYTDEARRLHIEGDVLIEALFAASGRVRVLRVVRGLGHGLDENAITAAGGIRFRPAMQGGQAADTVAMLRIQFQLLY